MLGYLRLYSSSGRRYLASMGYNPVAGHYFGYAAGNAGMSANIFVGNLDVPR